ncbi:MAG: hypothetical protein Q9N26_05340 [Aquificota bacterium]|nr:hypothetical protein [Aquificota bacterium]MDQ7083165.1 hypothetical protein [Aquificota bacterium]
MRWLKGLLVGLFAFISLGLAHEEEIEGFVHYHYYYNEHGTLVFVPVFHGWDHPHAVIGTGFVFVPVVPRVEVHEVHKVYIHKPHHWNGHFRVKRYHRPVRHYFFGH